ncbi:transmembrane protein 218 [Xiphophorus maculatus]|uniref:Transmembrane protein 218 n=1 Tax=Xiphophorus maculatus TaxID=8083 RepID=A0A3B5RE32_XIPMA|nr:transmembrane protein 218 [Xiphophorus maculatus]
MIDMTNTVLQVGTGVVVIVIVWIAALVVGTILLRADGSGKLGVIPTTLLALIITLVLVFFPRSPETPLPFKEIEIVDTFFIGRYVLLAVVGTVFLVAFFMLLPLHFLEPVHAKALRTY